MRIMDWSSDVCSSDLLIERTVEAAAGAKHAIIHLYNACAPAFRKIVFRMNRDEVRDVAVQGTRMVRAAVARHPETPWRYEYSPAVFSTTQQDFALEVCNAVTEPWEPTFESNKI